MTRINAKTMSRIAAAMLVAGASTACARIGRKDRHSMQAARTVSGGRRIAAEYSNDFETAQAGREWSSSRTETTPSGRKFLGRFVNNAAVKLSLGKGSPVWPGGLPKHRSVTVSFDLFVIHSWDGEKYRDKWSLRVEDGPMLVHTSFANPLNGTAPNPQSFPAPAGKAMFPARTGAAEVNALGYWNIAPRRFGDSVYRLRYTFPHVGDSLAFNFAADGYTGKPRRGLADESWGLDNVSVRISDEAVPGVAGAYTASLRSMGKAARRVAPMKPVDGRFRYVVKGDMEIYLNGKKIHVNSYDARPHPRKLQTNSPDVTLRAGDIVAVRIHSRYVHRCLRMAFISRDGKRYLPLRRRDLRRVNRPIPQITASDVSAAGESAHGGRQASGFRGAWEALSLPAKESEWIWGPGKGQWYQYAFVVRPEMFRKAPPPPVDGRFRYVCKGHLSLYHNGKKIHTSDWNGQGRLDSKDTTSPKVRLRAGDIVAVRIISGYVHRCLRMAFVSMDGKSYLPVRRSDLRRIEGKDIARITAANVSGARETAGSCRPASGFRGAWEALELPARESEWAWGPGKGRWHQYAFVVRPEMFRKSRPPAPPRLRPLPMGGRFRPRPSAMPDRHAKVRGVALEVLVPRVLRADGPMRTTVTLANESRIPVVCGDAGSTPDCRMRIVDAATGKACALTDYGKSLFGKHSPRSPLALVMLRPDQSKSWTIDLRKCFRLSKGKYRLFLTATVNPHEPARSFDIACGAALDVR